MPRSIRCSFCKQSGHNIRHCTSNKKDIFKNVIMQYIAIDYRLKLNRKYAKYILSIYPLESVRILGFMCDVEQPDMALLKNKTSYNTVLFHNQLMLLVTGIIDKLAIYYPQCISPIMRDICYDDMIQHSYTASQYIQEHCYNYKSLRQIHDILFRECLIIIDFSVHCDNKANYSDDCVICFHKLNNDNIIRTNCNHAFCIECLYKWFETQKITHNKQPLCPLCRCHIIQLTTDAIRIEDSIERYKNIPALSPRISTKTKQDASLVYYSSIINEYEKKFIIFLFTVALTIILEVILQPLRTPILSTV
jgi:hypothetical protein